MLASQGSSVVIALILVRLLGPREFGLIGMVTIITGLLNTVRDFGIGSAIVQIKGLSNELISSSFWLSFIAGLGLTSFLYLSSGIIADFYDEPILESICKLLSFTFVIGSLSTIQVALFQKRIDFRSIFWINVLSILISGLVSIYLALNGHGVFSLVWRSLTLIMVSTISYFFLSDWFPLFAFHPGKLRNVINFSFPLLGTQVLNYLVRNFDDLVVGKYLGSTSLGYYNQAYRIMLFPVSQLTGVLAKVLFSAFSEIQEDRQRIRSVFIRSISVLSFFTFPSMAFLSFQAEEVVLVLFGRDWLPMVNVVRCLAIVGAFQSIGAMNSNIFLALGKTSYQFAIGIPPRLLTIVFVLLGLSHGIDGVAVGYLVAVITNTIYMYYFTGRLIGTTLLDLFRIIRYPLIGTIGSVFVVFFLRSELQSLIGSQLIEVIVLLLCALVSYYLLFYLIGNRQLSVIESEIKGLLKS